MRFFFFALSLLFVSPAFAAPPISPTQPFDAYLKRPEGYSWKVVGHTANTTTFDLNSQKWQGVQWQHRLVVYQPKKLLFPGTAVLMLTIQPMPWDALTCRAAADSLGAPFVVLYDVPNQPIWGRTEDYLFGYSLRKMFETDDPTWSLAFPMAKSATRAMDAIQSWSKAQKKPITRFAIIGFSKRGLAAWLAATDPRVKALISIGYNNLNVSKQGPNQLSEWGEYSHMLRAYTGNGLIEKINAPEGQKLMATWDPWSFRNRLTMPKYIVDATNNGYWTLDAFNLYGDDLKGPSNLFYVANAGHYMENAVPTLLASVAGWCRQTLEGKILPQPVLKRDGSNLTLIAPGAGSAQLYYTFAASPDTRESQWTQIPMLRGKTGTFSGQLPNAPTDKPITALFAEGEYKNDGMAFKISSRTQTGAS